MIVQQILVVTTLLTGLFFLTVAAIGFVRLPDVFCRLHINGVMDTLGVPLILLGAAIYIGPSLAAGKLILGIAFIAITSPLVGHLLARAALEAGHEPGIIEDSTVISERFGRARSGNEEKKPVAELGA